MATLGAGIELTWLGHSTFLVKTPGGKSVLIDPWVASNPMCPESQKQLASLDTMLLTHAHFDHIADAVTLGKQHRPVVVGIFELCAWLERKGIERCQPMNKGGTQVAGDIRVTMVHADHSCGITDGDQILYGGEAAGYVVEFAHGYRLYHAGDTAVFGDMRIIAELYRPDLILLPIGDLYTMSPREAAYACRLLHARRVIPMHYGTFPSLTGTPAALREACRDQPGLEIIELRPGETLR